MIDVRPEYNEAEIAKWNNMDAQHQLAFIAYTYFCTYTDFFRVKKLIEPKQRKTMAMFFRELADRLEK